MDKVKALFKKYWKFLVVIVGLIILYILYKRHEAANASASASTTSPEDLASQYAAQAAQEAALNPTTAPNALGQITSPQQSSVGGDTSVVQPGTSASGLPSNSPQVLAYTSPAALTMPSPSSAVATSLSGSGGNPATTSSDLPASWQNYDPNSAAITLANTPASSSVFNAAPCTNPFICTPAYEAYTANLENQNCASDPTGASCQIANLVDPNRTGAPTAAGAALEASNVCEQSTFNASVFGQPTNPGCNGNTPSQGLFNTLLNQYGGTNPNPTSTTDNPDTGLINTGGTPTDTFGNPIKTTSTTNTPSTPTPVVRNTGTTQVVPVAPPTRTMTMIPVSTPVQNPTGPTGILPNMTGNLPSNPNPVIRR
jgi:hypothetical protein